MARNLFGKSVKMSAPYAVYKGYSRIFGKTETRVLKTYQTPDKEATNQYARWFVAVQTDWTHGSWDMGDTCVREALDGVYLVRCSKEWAEAYPHHVTSDTVVSDNMSIENV